ncbi:hypothetical protein FZI85_25070 [Mycobacterium sp. CBMA293]|uniref:hypothetical protein n=1 Tax=unclassified Mycolicibacterium TaxID=2636767 RepID=UPI0012DC9D42|nr:MULTISPECIES: hypothetical protein [unclassified Mycolicibacterium]MUL47589.1 hypothetical protein [Mycolicibacterium sp. CBMA 360]MUL61893.1 hypothetical protein [Mycolicibacterium sp. CBMA 335]MUL68966.1 hypothetical protein [Mycolicibacterium sp. CBMA 311]MUL92817.1 hypothetical protein [Mycolicibacterium sp. CBMA 230]MUM08741.1 hypothetical protein [Mycolicibacterium sp. CBMA 213]
MNRAQRRAAARRPDPHICEHGNPKKTDGNGNPMCPRGCGFTPAEREGVAAELERMRKRATGTTAAVMAGGRLGERVVLMPRQHGRPQTAVTKAIGKYASITAPPDYKPVDWSGRGA